MASSQVSMVQRGASQIGKSKANGYLGAPMNAAHSGVAAPSSQSGYNYICMNSIRGEPWPSSRDCSPPPLRVSSAAGGGTSGQVLTAVDLPPQIITRLQQDTLHSPEVITDPSASHHHNTPEPCQSSSSSGVSSSKPAADQENKLMAQNTRELLKRQGLNLSRPSLLNILHNLAHKASDINSYLYHLGVMCLLSTITAALSLQLVYHTTALYNSGSDTFWNSDIISVKTLSWFRDVSLGLCAVVVMFDLSCLVVCTMQFTYAVRMMGKPQGSEGAVRFLEQCSTFRVIVSIGFYISIPAFLAALALYILHTLPIVPTAIMTGILGVGVIFTLTSIVHNSYIWSQQANYVGGEVEKMESKEPKLDKKAKHGKRKKGGVTNEAYVNESKVAESTNMMSQLQSELTNKELSTLV